MTRRPSSGMRPRVEIQRSESQLGSIVVLIVKREPEETTAALRHMVRRTHDPAERYDSALRVLSATYYQRAKEFSDEMTALFGPSSETANRLLAARECILDFEQYNQRYRLPCSVRNLPDTDPAFQATYWHNSLFNPHLPRGISILAFTPDWARGQADPPVT